MHVLSHPKQGAGVKSTRCSSVRRVLVSGGLSGWTSFPISAGVVANNSAGRQLPKQFQPGSLCRFQPDLESLLRRKLAVGGRCWGTLARMFRPTVKEPKQADAGLSALAQCLKR